MTEDIACGLAFLVSVADYAGVEVPVARSLLTLAGVVAGIDFMKEGRTLGSLGLSHSFKAGTFPFSDGRLLAGSTASNSLERAGLKPY